MNCGQRYYLGENGDYVTRQRLVVPLLVNKIMLLEVEDETRDFVTIYRKDFPSKKGRRPKEHRPQAEYRPPLNILNGPYRKCLNTRRINATLPLNEQTEDPGDTLNRIREEQSHLKETLPKDVPDEDLIERKNSELQQTVYQLDYSKDNYSFRMEISGKKKDVSLPKDWVISETIQRKSYRNPWKIVPRSLLHVKKAVKPSHNLIPSEKEREILRIRTGDSEYDATIQATGNRVIKECLLGPPLPVEPQIYIKVSDSPPSECSEILAGKKFVLPSNIF